MKCLIFLSIVCLTTATLDYEGVLQSPLALKNLFNEYSAKYGKLYSAAEQPLRFRLFRADLKRVVQLNKEHDWTSGVNMFSGMTAAEKQSYLGLNITSEVNVHPEPLLSSAPAASSIDWRTQGKVTGVKNQGGCGSCWAFSAIGAVETNYAVTTNKRKAFSEQEYLDCTYESERGRDGCKGGWYYQAWEYSAKDHRLATSDAAPYRERDQACRYGNVHNGLIAAEITGATYVPKGESNMISYLNQGAVSVAYEVTDDFFKYTEGIIADNTCKSWANHAVTAVGYTHSAMIVKNSWGSWGMKGYFYTRRGHHGCQIFDHGAIPTMHKTNRRDNDPDYVPSDDDDCKGTNADGCPCGTVRCGDGQCRHAHMCH